MQKLTGTFQQIEAVRERGSRAEMAQTSVRLELQADCYADALLGLDFLSCAAGGCRVVYAPVSGRRRSRHQNQTMRRMK